MAKTTSRGELSNVAGQNFPAYMVPFVFALLWQRVMVNQQQDFKGPRRNKFEPVYKAPVNKNNLGR